VAELHLGHADAVVVVLFCVGQYAVVHSECVRVYSSPWLSQLRLQRNNRQLFICKILDLDQRPS